MVTRSSINVAISVASKPKSLHERIVQGSVVLLSGSGLTMAINLAYNIGVARFLGPQGFGHATVVYTLLTLLSAITLSFQIVSTKVVAQQQTPEGKAAVYRMLHRASWVCGIAVGVGFFVFERPVAEYLNLPSAALVGILGIGAAFYIPLGTRRGFVQGTYGFRRLASNLVLECAVRLAGSMALIFLGAGVRGVIAANSAAIAAAYLVLSSPLAKRIPNPLHASHAMRETMQALVFFAGQVLINNCDIILVKHFFPAKVAGLYAAIAMVGRVIYSFSQAVVNSTFPIVAGTRDEERRDLRVIATSLLLVLGSGTAIAVGLCFAPAQLWSKLFGSEFVLSGRYTISYLLALYALTTVVYSLSAVIITFEMSYKIANTSWVQLAFSGFVILGICWFHSSLLEVILVQLILLLLLFVAVAIPFLVNSLTDSRAMSPTGPLVPVRLLRRVPEDAVIAEFLKSDFHRPEFRDYQSSMREVVLQPNLDDPEENDKRRALFFIRHLSLWKEIPGDTEWYEIEMDEPHLENISIFPRAQWRKVANGSFSISDIVDGMQNRRTMLDSQFTSKVTSIAQALGGDEGELGSVIVIGLNQGEPLTVIDGNHRLVASLLSTPRQFRKLRFLCGLSPRMSECCWYNSNLVTLFRYARNVLTNTVRRPEAELARVLRRADERAA